MQRRTFFSSLAAAPGLAFVGARPAVAVPLPRAKITRVRMFEPPTLNPLFNQSNMVCTVETDIGVTGIGEGGSKDTLERPQPLSCSSEETKTKNYDDGSPDLRVMESDAIG